MASVRTAGNMAPPRPKASSVRRCPSCGSTDIDSNGQRGDSACMSCGAVLEENRVTSDVTFTENSSGQSQMVGQHVPANQGTSSMLGGLNGISKDSREVTIINGKKKISQVAAALKLASRHIEAAQQLFMLAVSNNFIQGRKTQNVVAACLYIVCRREKTSHMLIDFSDVLQTNVYVLGHTFLKFRRLLNLQLPIIDPSLYIHRFAAKLEFGEKTHVVAMAALRLVSRMKRDWIQTGRRPSGICGAALLIAARLHGFRRTQQEIVMVVRVCDITLRRRLDEFQDTPSGNLTPAEFLSVDLEEECDPPAFRKAREKEKEKSLDDDTDEPPAKRRRVTEGDTESQAMANQMQEALQSDEFVRAQRELLASAHSQQTERRAAAAAASAGEASVEDNLDDLDDTEIDSFLLSGSEQQSKEQLWMELNRDYLAEQKEKERIAAENLAAGIQPKQKKSYKKRKRNADGTMPRSTPRTAAEATQSALRARSSKINYAALDLPGLFDEEEQPRRTSGAETTAPNEDIETAMETTTGAGAVRGDDDGGDMGDDDAFDQGVDDDGDGNDYDGGYDGNDGFD